MPQTKNPIERYRIIDRCLRDAHRNYTLETLLDAVNRQLRYTSGQEISRRTLQNDLTEIEYKYGADYDEKLRKQRPAIYKYANPEDIYEFIELPNKDTEKIQEAINILSEYQGNPQYDWALMLLKEAQMCSDCELSSCVDFQNNPELQGLEHFAVLLDAIVSKQVLAISYQPYDRPSLDTKLSPIRLKQYNNRWYVIGKCPQYDNISIFPLDRILSISQTKDDYEQADIDVDELFDNQIGISITRDAKVEDVIIRVKKDRYNYIKTKPLHWSQAELKDQATDETRTIRIRVFINKELIQQLLSFGDDLVVIAPETLRQQIKEKINAMNENYC